MCHNTKYYSSTTLYYKVLLCTLKYYSVLHSTTPALLRTTQYYSVLRQSISPVLESITPYYKVPVQYYKVLLSTILYCKVLLRTTKYYSSTTPYYTRLLCTTKYYTVLFCTTKYYSVLCTTKYYTVLLRTTKCYTVLLRTTKYYTVQCAETPWRCKTQCNCDIHNPICWALKPPVQCAEQFLELKIYVSLRFRAIKPPNPARGFIQKNQNVRLATAARNQKFANVRFATAACAKMYEIYVSLQFRAINPPNPARGFIQQNQNVCLATAARNQKFANVRFATAACAKMYETSERRPRHLAAYKNHHDWSTTPPPTYPPAEIRV